MAPFVLKCCGDKKDHIGINFMEERITFLKAELEKCTLSPEKRSLSWYFLRERWDNYK